MKTRPKRQGAHALPTELLARVLGHLPARERAVAEAVCRRWRRVLSRPDIFGGVVDGKFVRGRSAQLQGFCAWLLRRLGGAGAANLAAAPRPARPLPHVQLSLQLAQPLNAADAATTMMSLAMLLGGAGHRLTCIDLQLRPALRSGSGSTECSGSLQLDVLCLPLSAATRLAIQAPAIDLSDGLAHLASLQELRLDFDSLTSRLGATPSSSDSRRGSSPCCAASSTTGSSAAQGCSRRPSDCCTPALQPLLRLPRGLTCIELRGCPEPGQQQALPQLRHLLAPRHSALLDLDLSYNTPASFDDMDGLAHLTRLQRLAWRGTASCGLGSMPAQLSALTQLSYLDLSVREFKQKDVGLLACLKGLRALGLEATGSLPALLDFADLALPRLEVLSLERVGVVLDSGHAAEACEAPFWSSLRTLQADSATVGGLWLFDLENSYLGRLHHVVVTNMNRTAALGDAVKGLADMANLQRLTVPCYACSHLLTQALMGLAQQRPALQVKVLRRDLLDLDELCEAAGLPLTPA